MYCVKCADQCKPEKLLFHARFPIPPEKLDVHARLPMPPEKLLFHARLPIPPRRRVRIQMMNQQGRPFLNITKFVHKNILLIDGSIAGKSDSFCPYQLADGTIP